MKSIHIYTDFDGTITEIDLGDDLFKQFGQFEPYHSQLLSGEISISEYWHKLFGTLENVDKSVVTKYATDQPTDAYFADFVKYCNDSGFPLSVVSDGFDSYIKPVLDNLGIGHIPFYCNKMIFEESSIKPFFTAPSESCDCMVASCKRNVLLKNTPPDGVIVYIGDGYSDFCAAEYSDIVFAKKNLAAYCFKNKIPHHNFHTFFDVKQILKKLIKDNRIKVRHQAYLKRKSAFEAE